MNNEGFSILAIQKKKWKISESKVLMVKEENRKMFSCGMQEYEEVKKKKKTNESVIFAMGLYNLEWGALPSCC